MTASRRHLLIALAVPALLALTTAVALAAVTDPSTPRLSINIPGMAPFSSIARNGDQVSISWLPEYLVGIYNWGLTVGGVMATVMMMWGGLQWMMGNAKAGEERIRNAAVGLVILFSAYVILTIVSPDTTAIKSLNFQTTGQQTQNFHSGFSAASVAGKK